MMADSNPLEQVTVQLPQPVRRDGAWVSVAPMDRRAFMYVSGRDVELWELVKLRMPSRGDSAVVSLREIREWCNLNWNQQATRLLLRFRRAGLLAVVPRMDRGRRPAANLLVRAWDHDIEVGDVFGFVYE
jgi:hypothetical protein